MQMQGIQETQAQSPGREDPLEKGVVTDSNILAWAISWTEDSGRLTVHGVAKSWTQLKRLSTLAHKQDTQQVT